MKDRIRTLRNHFALSQEQFGEKINKTTSFVSTVETGRCGLSQSTFDTVCRVFGVNEEWLRTGTGEMLIKPTPAIDKEQIGGRVKEVRERLGLSQRNFADLIGFHKNQVGNVELGKSIPSEEFLISIAKKFNISISWLKTGEGEMKITGDPVDARLIEWLRKNPEIARELRIRGGLD